MSMDLESLRDAFLAVPAGPPRVDCPQAAEIWDAAQGHLSPSRLAKIVDHLAACMACREAWRLASDLQESASQARAPEVIRPAANAWWPWAAAAAAAAVLVVAFALPGWGTLGRRPRPGAPLRGSVTAELQSLISETDLQPRNHLLLRWSPADRGARYRVHVTTRDLTEVAGAAGLDAPEFVVPEKSLASLPPKATLLWQVSATLPDGRSITSPTFVVRVR
ncbi:MAG TPA: hypothetical protein VKJ00_00310 [Thermoanaerobaculia bacterium]|nr:hypothetical protein [Thermoanaerobaculia bacterium]